MAPRPDLHQRLEAARQKVWGAKAAAAGRIFSSPDGKELLRALEREFFDGALLGDSVEQTHMNLGAREVVRFLRDLARMGTNVDPLS